MPSTWLMFVLPIKGILREEEDKKRIIIRKKNHKWFLAYGSSAYDGVKTISNQQKPYSRFWISIFSQASDMWHSTLSWRWAVTTSCRSQSAMWLCSALRCQQLWDLCLCFCIPSSLQKHTRVCLLLLVRGQRMHFLRWHSR